MRKIEKRNEKNRDRNNMKGEQDQEEGRRRTRREERGGEKGEGEKEEGVPIEGSARFLIVKTERNLSDKLLMTHSSSDECLVKGKKFSKNNNMH